MSHFCSTATYDNFTETSTVRTLVVIHLENMVLTQCLVMMLPIKLIVGKNISPTPNKVEVVGDSWYKLNIGIQKLSKWGQRDIVNTNSKQSSQRNSKYSLKCPTKNIRTWEISTINPSFVHTPTMCFCVFNLWLLVVFFQLPGLKVRHSEFLRQFSIFKAQHLSGGGFLKYLAGRVPNRY